MQAHGLLGGAGADLGRVDARRAVLVEHRSRPRPRPAPAARPGVYARCHGSIGAYDHVTRSSRTSGTRSAPVSSHDHTVSGAVGDVVGAREREREPELLEHVGADAVGAERDACEARRAPVADRVVEVRARVVHDGAGQLAFEVHGVGEDPPIVGAAGEARARRGVDGVFGDVHVHADAEIGREAAHRVERLVGERERRVRADEPAPARAQEPLVLGEAGLGAVGAVAIGDLVAAQHAHADLGARLRDHVEAALDRVRARVMVDDRGRPRLERLERAEQRAPAQHLEVEGAVDAPPDELEDLGERARACAAARACRARARSRGGCARRPGPGSWRSRRSSALIGRGASAATTATRRRDRAARRATAPAVGTSPISPTPLIPYGARGCGSSTRITSIGGTSLARMMPRPRSVMSVGRPSSSHGKSSVSA